MSRLPLLLGLALLPLLAQAALDPTQPPASPTGSAPAAAGQALPAVRLQAILRGPDGARAVIDGQTLRVGDQHGELRLLAVRARSVLIERQGQRSELLLSQPILTPSSRSTSR